MNSNTHEWVLIEYNIILWDVVVYCVRTELIIINSVSLLLIVNKKNSILLQQHKTNILIIYNIIELDKSYLHSIFRAIILLRMCLHEDFE